MEHRQIKFQEILAELIGQNNHSRAEICKILNITPSALSQYLHGQTIPALQKLVDLARFFKVSLDYLVLGEERDEMNEQQKSTGPYTQDITEALAHIQIQSIRHIQLVERIAQALTKEIDEKAQEIAQQTTILSDMWTNEDLFLLESYSQETKILTFDLRFDIVPDATSASGYKQGPFFRVVESNLKQERSYQFLLLGEVHKWKPIIMAFLDMLPGNVRGSCKFRCTTSPVISGCGFYHLDRSALREKEPTLFARVSEGIDDSGWAGYTMTPAQGLDADLKMDITYLHQAQAAFATLWDKAEEWR